MTEFKFKAAKQIDMLVELAFKAGAIKQDTYDAGKTYALHMEGMKRNERNTIPASIQQAAEDARLRFDTLFDRDTASLPGNGEGGQ